MRRLIAWIPNFTAKGRAFVGAVVFTLSSALEYIASISPSLQNQFIQNLQQIVPLSWRPEVSAITKFICLVAFLYTAKHLANSIPQEPLTKPKPVQPPSP